MRLRTAAQYGLLLPLWVLFFWAWERVLSSWPSTDLFASLRLLALIGSLCGVVITLWIRHNIGIFRRKGPRMGVRQASMSFSRDSLGREVALSAPDVFQARCVVVGLEGGRKVYRTRASKGEDRSLASAGGVAAKV